MTARIPRLTLRFVVWTACGLTAAAVIVFVLLSRHLTAQEEQQAVGRAEVTARAVLPTLLQPRDLTNVATRSRRRRLDTLFARDILVGGPVRASIVRRDGTVLYATDRARIGTTAAPLSPSATRVVSTVADAGPPLGRELAVTVPLKVAGRLAGVLRLEQPYAPLAASARRTALELAAIVEGVFVLLLCALAPALQRASARMRRQVEELDHVATHDLLLEVPNRLGLARRVEGLGDRTASLLILDLVAFREVNEALGSERGDLLLSAWAGRLASADLGCETLGRIGVDELCLLFSSCDRDEIDRLVERVHDVLREPVDVDGIGIALEVTIGVALIPEHGRDFDELLRRASVALTHARDVGEGAAVFDASHDARHTVHLRRTAELRDALRRGELTVHYQPQADLGTHSIRGAEALLRWHHPRQGLLEAGAFIGSAQRSGLITELDRFVLATAMRQWQEWAAAGIEVDLAANLAPVDLLDTGLPDEIGALIEEHDVDASYVVLEITEVAMVQDDSRTRDVLGRLRRLGVHLAIDDYGTGYSSLGYLRSLDVDQIKLDRSFIEKLPESAVDRAIVRSTTELAHTLGATVVAEGIETHEQWEAAARQGCDIAQGYLVSRALTPEKLTDLLVVQRAHPRRPVLRLAQAEEVVRPVSGSVA